MEQAIDKAKQMARVRRAVSQLVMDSPFWGMLILALDVQESSAVDTMSTDGKRLLINPAFVATLTDAELRGVLVHEVYHCAADHMARQGTRELKLWNEAADYSINQEIMALGYALPKGRLLDSKWQGMAAESIYAALYQAREQERQQGGSGNQQAGNGAPQPSQNGNGNQQGNSPGAQGTPSHGAPQGMGEAAGNDPGGCGGIIPAQPDEREEISKAWRERTIQAAAIAARHAGKVPGGLKTLVDEIRTPRISWREALRRYVTQSMSRDYSWSRPNRRFIGRGVYLPSLVSDGRGRIIVAVDTSGSIDGAALSAFRGELQAMLDEQAADCVSVVYCDCQLQGEAEFQAGDVLTLETPGRGGTAFAPVMAWARDNGHDAACMIYFTDMKCSLDDFGHDPGLPVIWANWHRPPRHSVPFGDVVQIDGHGN